MVAVAMLHLRRFTNFCFLSEEYMPPALGYRVRDLPNTHSLPSLRSARLQDAVWSAKSLLVAMLRFNEPKDDSGAGCAIAYPTTVRSLSIELHALEHCPPNVHRQAFFTASKYTLTSFFADRYGRSLNHTEPVKACATSYLGIDLCRPPSRPLILHHVRCVSFPISPSDAAKPM